MCRNLTDAEGDDYLRGSWEGFLADARQTAGTLLLSHEAFSRRHVDGRTTDRLHELMPDAAILVVVRSQSTVLHSLYHQYLKHGGTRPFDAWATTVLDRRWIRYDAVVAEYQRRFSPERVRVLAYEQLVADPAGFVAELRRFVLGELGEGEPGWSPPRVNRSLARPSCWALRHMNRLFRKSELNPRPRVYPIPLHKAMRLIRAVDTRYLGERYRSPSPRDGEAIRAVVDSVRESNERLAELTGLDLGVYGYPLPVAAGRLLPA